MTSVRRGSYFVKMPMTRAFLALERSTFITYFALWTTLLDTAPDTGDNLAPFIFPVQHFLSQKFLLLLVSCANILLFLRSLHFDFGIRFDSFFPRLYSCTGFSYDYSALQASSVDLQLSQQLFTWPYSSFVIVWIIRVRIVIVAFLRLTIVIVTIVIVNCNDHNRNHQLLSSYSSP